MSIELPILPAEPKSRPAGVWDYISASRLNLWLRCPLAFKLRYIEGVSTPPTPSLFLGKRVHAGLEHFYRHRQLGVDLPAEDVVGRMLSGWETAAADEGVRFADQAEEAESRDQAVRLVATYLQAVPSDEPRPLAVETALECPLVDPATGEDFGLPLLGVVDLVLGGETGPLVVDFKTAAKADNPVEILHEVQLTTYSWLFRATAGRPESGLEIRSLIKTKTPKLGTQWYSARTAAHYRRFFRLVRAYLDNLDSGRFVYRPGFHCSLCEFRERCAAWDGE